MPKGKPRRKRTSRASKARVALTLPPPRLTQPGIAVADPQFGETKHSPDPTQFLHAVTDARFYKAVDKETVNQLINSGHSPSSRPQPSLALSCRRLWLKWSG
jgi:hypothetical protein